MKTHNKMFDFISLRYLYHKGEDHEVKPDADAMVDDLKLTYEMAESKSMELGVSGESGGVKPSATVHVQKDNKITTERITKSWRKGFTYESCKSNSCFRSDIS